MSITEAISSVVIDEMIMWGHRIHAEIWIEIRGEIKKWKLDKKPKLT